MKIGSFKHYLIQNYGYDRRIETERWVPKLLLRFQPTNNGVKDMTKGTQGHYVQTTEGGYQTAKYLARRWNWSPRTKKLDLLAALKIKHKALDPE